MWRETKCLGQWSAGMSSGFLDAFRWPFISVSDLCTSWWFWGFCWRVVHILTGSSLDIRSPPSSRCSTAWPIRSCTASQAERVKPALQMCLLILRRTWKKEGQKERWIAKPTKCLQNDTVPITEAPFRTELSMDHLWSDHADVYIYIYIYICYITVKMPFVNSMGLASRLIRVQLFLFVQNNLFCCLILKICVSYHITSMYYLNYDHIGLEYKLVLCIASKVTMRYVSQYRCHDMIRITIQMSRYDTYHDTAVTIWYVSRYSCHDMIRITIQMSRYDTYHDTDVTIWYASRYTCHDMIRITIQMVTIWYASRYRCHDMIRITIQMSRYDTHHDTHVTIWYASRYRCHYMIRITIQMSRYDTHHDTDVTIWYVSRYRCHDMIRITIQMSRYDTYHNTDVTIWYVSRYGPSQIFMNVVKPLFILNTANYRAIANYRQSSSWPLHYERPPQLYHSII